MGAGRTMYGRQVIYTDVKEIDKDNVVKVLEKALQTHRRNRSEIQYLYDYYKGKQPVLNRVKDVRPEINNKIVENNANHIVSFKVGYLMGEPVQYVNRGAESASDAINQLNGFVFAEDKAVKDKEIADWFTICGTSFRMILPDAEDEKDEAPFEIYTLDPRNTFVVYHNGLGNKPVMGVTYVTQSDNSVVYSVYTKNKLFTIKDNGDKKVDDKDHICGCIPIIEYPANTARLGAFETVLPILDALNELSSNRLDGVEQFVQALLMFKGVNVEKEDYLALREEGGIVVPPDGDVKYLTQELNQTQTQAFVDYLYQRVLTVCEMPNRNGGSSTSDTGAAVIMRDGWQAAEAYAKNTELMFKQSEKQFLRLLIRITNSLRNMNLKLSDIEIRFTRRNYENIQEKTQVLTTMLANDKIHPRLAFEHCGMFADPGLAYAESMLYAEEKRKETVHELEQFAAHAVNTQKAEINGAETSGDGENV